MKLRSSTISLDPLVIFPEPSRISDNSCIDIGYEDTVLVSTLLPEDSSSSSQLFTHRIALHRSTGQFAEHEVSLPSQRITGIQPLPNNQLFVRFRAEQPSIQTNLPKEGVIVRGNGRRDLFVGIGIGVSDTQTGPNGSIWIGYTDVGVFANPGYGKEIGKSGLVALDQDGQRIYEYHPPKLLEPIADCYAFNVEDELRTWVYYYPNFDLVGLEQLRPVFSWKSSISRARNFAVACNGVLLHQHQQSHDFFHLFRFDDNGHSEEVGIYTVVDSKSRKIRPQRLLSRAGAIYLITDSEVYRLDVSTAMATS